MAGIRGILFDLGDTLLDFGAVDTIDLFEQGAKLTYAYLQEHGFTLPSFSEYHRKQLRAIRRAYLWSHIRRREFNSLDIIGKLALGMGHNLLPEDLDEVAWRWYEPLSRQATVEPGLHAMLGAFTDSGITLGIISNTFIPAHVLDRHLAAVDLLDLLPVRVYSCNVRYRKPDRRIFRHALDQASLAPEQTLFVGDTPKADIRGARRAGLVPVLKDPHGRHATSRIRADYTIRSLCELTGIVEQFA